MPKNASHLPEFCALHDDIKTCSPVTGYNLMKANKIKYFPKGKWVNLKQVLKLNTPSQPDGRLTVWVDGVQKFDFDRIIFRTDGVIKIDGWTMQTCNQTSIIRFLIGRSDSSFFFSSFRRIERRLGINKRLLCIFQKLQI